MKTNPMINYCLFSDSFVTYMLIDLCTNYPTYFVPGLGASAGVGAARGRRHSH